MPRFRKAVVVDARDLPVDVDDWCVDHEISTHYAESLVRIWKNDDYPNALTRWLESEGVKLSEFDDGRIVYVARIGTWEQADDQD